jgi:hypothetical protein
MVQNDWKYLSVLLAGPPLVRVCEVRLMSVIAVSQSPYIGFGFTARLSLRIASLKRHAIPRIGICEQRSFILHRPQLSVRSYEATLHFPEGRSFLLFGWSSA